RPVGAVGASDPQAQVRHPQGRQTGHRPAGDPQRDLLPPAWRGRAGGAAPPPSPPPQRPSPPPPLAPLPALGEPPPPPPRRREGRGRVSAPAPDWADRQPDGQDDPCPR